MASASNARLRRDYAALKKDPPPFIHAAPLDTNILEWRYAIVGPPGTPYEGGIYHGKLKFPSDFPYKPPSIYMITPNGRFKTDTRLCLSMSDFHPGTWQPSWTVASILTGLLSFMLEDTATTGSIETSAAMKRKFAAASHAFNLQDRVFVGKFATAVPAVPTVSTVAGEARPAEDASQVGGAAQVPLASFPSLGTVLVLVSIAVAAWAVVQSLPDLAT